MQIPTPDELKEMAKEKIEYCITISMEAKPIVGGNIANPVRFNDLIAEAARRLLESNLTHDKIEKLLKPARELKVNDQFWKDQFKGLMVFIANDGIKSIKLPFPLPDQVSISHYCNLLSLINYQTNNFPYYLLVIDEGGCKLFIGSKEELQDISTEKIRNNEKNILDRFEKEEEEMYRVEKAGGRDAKHEAVIFHGHGNTKDFRKIRAEQYLNEIEKEVYRKIARSNLPLILVGHDFLIPLYQKKNTYHNLLSEHFVPNPGPLNLKNLHEKSWVIAENYYQKLMNEEKEKFFNLRGTELSSVDLLDIINAAKLKKISTLFINLDRIAYGVFENDNDTVLKLKKTDNPLDENLSNLAAAWAMQENAKVFAVSGSEMPEESSLCAIYRY